MAYLAEHPDAQDTIEGIVQWWLLERKIIHQIEKVRDVLADLVKKQLILETKTTASAVLYRLNPDQARPFRQRLSRGSVKTGRKRSR